METTSDFDKQLLVDQSVNFPTQRAWVKAQLAFRHHWHSGIPRVRHPMIQASDASGTLRFAGWCAPEAG